MDSSVGVVGGVSGSSGSLLSVDMVSLSLSSGAIKFSSNEKQFPVFLFLFFSFLFFSFLFSLFSLYICLLMTELQAVHKVVHQLPAIDDMLRRVAVFVAHFEFLSRGPEPDRVGRHQCHDLCICDF